MPAGISDISDFSGVGDSRLEYASLAAVSLGFIEATSGEGGGDCRGETRGNSARLVMQGCPFKRWAKEEKENDEACLMSYDSISYPISCSLKDPSTQSRISFNLA
jgi:hypothetical protein